MHWIAAILALAAVVCFLAEWYTTAPPRRPLPLGLALLTVAWMVQLVILTGSKLSVD